MAMNGDSWRRLSSSSGEKAADGDNDDLQSQFRGTWKLSVGEWVHLTVCSLCGPAHGGVEPGIIPG